MANFTTSQNFADDDQVTSVTLNGIVSGLVAESDFADDSTITVTAGGKIKVGTVGSSNIATDAVTTAKIADEAVTLAKIEEAAIANAAEVAAAAVTKLITADLLSNYPHFPKAYGAADGSGLGAGSYNIASAVVTSNDITVTFTDPMPDDTYTVLLGTLDGSENDCAVNSRTVNGFVIEVAFSADGASFGVFSSTVA